MDPLCCKGRNREVHGAAGLHCRAGGGYDVHEGTLPLPLIASSRATYLASANGGYLSLSHQTPTSYITHTSACRARHVERRADPYPQDDEITVLMQVPGKADTYLVSLSFLCL